MYFVTLTFELIIDNAHNEQNKAGVFLSQILDKTALNNFWYFKVMEIFHKIKFDKWHLYMRI